MVCSTQIVAFGHVAAGSRRDVTIPARVWYKLNNQMQEIVLLAALRGIPRPHAPAVFRDVQVLARLNGQNSA